MSLPTRRLGTAALRAATVAVALSSPREGAAGEPPPPGAISTLVPLAPAGDQAFGVERANVRGDGLVAARLVLDGAAQPVVARNAAQELDAVVARQATLHAMATLALRHRFALGVDVPLALAVAGEPPASGAAAVRPDGLASLGDLRLGARACLAATDDEAPTRAALALSTWLWLPTATDRYSGDGLATAAMAAVTEGEHAGFTWGASAGVRLRPPRSLPGIVPTRSGSQVALGLSGGFHPGGAKSVALGSEVGLAVPFTGGVAPFDPQALVARLWITAHYRPRLGPFELGVAFGPELGRAPGSAAYRGLASLGFAPEAPAPPADGDRDGIPDREDACVRTRGVRSSVPILHGCPEMDDRDGDAVPDEHDACPDRSGVATFEPRTHGCPPFVDRDGDRVEDDDDECPRVFGIDDPDRPGCPAPRSTVELGTERIAISEQVQFETDTAVLRAESGDVLVQVARLLRAHPEVLLVEVQGHTDDTGSAEHNERLAEARAERVVAWLVGHGVARERLVAKGYGRARPVASNSDETGRAANRRVEFHVLRRAEKP